MFGQALLQSFIGSTTGANDVVLDSVDLESLQTEQEKQDFTPVYVLGAIAILVIAVLALKK